MIKRLDYLIITPGMNDDRRDSLGACVLEKVYAQKNAIADQDVAHAIPVSRFPDLLTECTNVFHALGGKMRFLDDIRYDVWIGWD